MTPRHYPSAGGTRGRQSRGMTMIEVLVCGLITSILMVGIVMLFYAHWLGYFTAVCQSEMNREARHAVDDICQSLMYGGGLASNSGGGRLGGDFFSGDIQQTSNYPQVGYSTTPGVPFQPTTMAAQAESPTAVTPAVLDTYDAATNEFIDNVENVNQSGQNIPYFVEDAAHGQHIILGQHITDIEFLYEYRYPNPSQPGYWMFYRSPDPIGGDTPDTNGISEFYITTVYVTVTASMPNPLTGTLIYRTMTSAVHFRAPYLSDPPRALGD